MNAWTARICASLATLLVAVAAQAQNISIATGGTGGVYYPLGGGMAAVLSKYVPGMQATAEVTGGSVDNLKLIGTGKPYIAFTMTDAGAGRVPRRGQVQGQQGAAAHADGALSEPHARRHHRGHRRHQDEPTSRASASRPARPAARPR